VEAADYSAGSGVAPTRVPPVDAALSRFRTLCHAPMYPSALENSGDAGDMSGDVHDHRAFRALGIPILAVL